MHQTCECVKSKIIIQFIKLKEIKITGKKLHLHRVGRYVLEYTQIKQH